MTEIVGVVCRSKRDGWTCAVTVGGGSNAASYEVAVSRGELERFAPQGNEPSALVEESFRFLLERESKESILRTFELSVIERYFAEYPSEIRRRLAR